MNAFYLYPGQAVGWRGPARPSPRTSLALQLWQNPLAPAAQLRVIAAGPEPIDVTVYDTMGRVRYQATTAPNSTLPLENAHWAAGSYAVCACQGGQSVTRLLVRESGPKAGAAGTGLS